MKKIILFALAVLPVAPVSAQEAAPAASSSPAPTVSNATPATAADMQALREQVKDQQAALEKANLTGESGLPQNPEPSPIAGAEESAAPAANAPLRFPTEDTSVVSSTAAQPPSGGPGVNVSSTPAAGTF